MCPVDVSACYKLFMQLKELLLVDRLRGCWATEGQWPVAGDLLQSTVKWSEAGALIPVPRDL